MSVSDGFWFQIGRGLAALIPFLIIVGVGCVLFALISIDNWRRRR